MFPVILSNEVHWCIQSQAIFGQ